MSQHLIRKNAGMGAIRRAYYKLQEPRIVSAVYGIVYAAMLVTGIVSIVRTPWRMQYIDGGDTLMTIIGSFMAAGGLLGVVTVAMGWFWVERAAVFLGMTGAVFYLGVSAYLEFYTPAPMFSAMWFFTAFCTAVLISKRLRYIYRQPYETGTAADAQALAGGVHE